MEGVMFCRDCFQRAGGWCEPVSGDRAAGAGAGSPNEGFLVGDHGGPRYRRQRLVGALMSGVLGRNFGWYRGNVIYRPESE